MNTIVKSWKTTVLGVLTIIGAVVGGAMALIDNDPLTNPSWEVIIAAVTAGIGLIAAKDAGVSNAPSPGAAVKVPPSP